MAKNKQSNLIASVEILNIGLINNYIINSGIRGQLVLPQLFTEMGRIEIHVSAIRIARYFCIDIGIALATFQSIVYRYRLTHILRIADTCIADTNFTVT